MSVILHWQTVKNRKPHKCPLCGRTIPKDEYMISAAWADGGTVWGEKICLVCEEYWHSELNGEEFSFDDLIYGNDFETWDKIRKEMEAEDGKGN
jgi:hypothetical protein